MSMAAAATFCVITCMLLLGDGKVLNSKFVLVMLCLDLILILPICVHIFNRIKRLLVIRYKKGRRNRFHTQIITLFSCVTALPAICVFMFAILFFNVGIENLFKNPVKNVIENAEQVASIYVEDMKINMENFVNGLVDQVKDGINGIFINKEQIAGILERETEDIKVDAAVLQLVDKNNVNVIVQTPLSVALQPEEIPDDITFLNDGEVIAWDADGTVVAAAVISRDFGIYLVASTQIEKVILDHKHKIKQAVMEYTDLSAQRAGLKVSFITFFSCVTLLLILLSCLAGILFANWVLRPVNKLIVATQSITSGNYNEPIKTGKFRNEWDTLIQTFNNMIEKLEQQKQQLIISNTHNAWRDIARKIAHEIKNPLTPIQLAAERLKKKYQGEIKTQPEIFNSCIDTISRQVASIGRLVKEFSDFARMPAPCFEFVDIIALLKGIVLLQSSSHPNLLFHQSYSHDIWQCSVDPGQINQVIMNILQNAVNAMVEGTANADDKIVGNVMLEFTVKGEHMVITIEDDGPGFADGAIEKALSPYYTTRAAGTGLGLAIAHKIITDHFGTINLGRSAALHGAMVEISIPVTLKNYGSTNDI
jgi:two-component system nitrogen regulation sensor histidine kinase NtrY